MSDFTSSTGSGLSDVPGQAADAAASLGDLGGSAKDAADSIDKAFDRAGTSLAKTLAKAAADGKVSLGELATAVIQAVDAAGGAGGGGGLAGALGALLGSAFGGARADGGPVTAGGAYLVGERGPEVFRPASAGTVDAGGAATPAAGPRMAEPPASAPVTVTLNLPAGTDAPSLVRSQAQVAQALARAVALGRR